MAIEWGVGMVGVDDFPLVTVCVISYNSCETIIETLESIKKQTYANIELIVSDDNSKDGTVSVINEWCKVNGDRFVAYKILTVDKNTGVTGNCNRAVKNASGEFIKDIGADDILLPTYIEDCVNYFIDNSNCGILFTKLTPFYENDISHIVNIEENYDFFNLSQSEQWQYIINNGLPLLPTPTSIYRKTTLQNIGFYDMDIPMWEDGPMYFRLSEAGVKFFLLEKEEVLYRIRSNSLSNNLPKRHIISISIFYLKYFYKYEKMNNKLKAFYHYFKYSIGRRVNNPLFYFLFLITQLHVKKQASEI